MEIIGSFNNIDKVNEDGESTTKQNLVKIIKAESLGSLQWDSNYVNNWDTSSLKISLINYYNGIKLGEEKVLSHESKSLIENIKWNLGGYPRVTGVLTAEWYELERENNAYQTNPVTWNGKIALSYPSDYGYATSGGTTGRETCIENSVYYWNEDAYKTNCVDNDWLYLSNGSMWLLPPNYLNSHDAVSLYKTGKIDNRSTQSSAYVYPSLYLTHDTKINGGDGTYENPYTIAIQ